MSIYFNCDKEQFYLNTKNTSYVIELLNREIPLHVYWGKRIEDIPSATELGYIHAGNISVFDVEGEYPFISTFGLPLEFPCYGTGDMREPAFHAIYENGSRITDLKYKSYSIVDGKPVLEGLPATYGDKEHVSTLILKLADNVIGLSVQIQYSVFEDLDIITRSVKIENNGRQVIDIQKNSSMSIDFYDSDFEIIYPHGDWAREFGIEENNIPYGITRFDSKCGKSGHYHNPFVVLSRPNTTETEGEVYAVNLVYSGNFEISIEKNTLDIIRIQAGINSFDFSWKLNPSENFQSPEVVLIHSEQGLGEMSRRFHRVYRENLCRGQYKNAIRPILINNWEATYWDFTEETILEIAKKAQKLGIEMLVLDDGWFGERNSDSGSLGDWFCNYKKLPNGLKGLSDKLNELGLKFGIWVEPEMVSPNSKLYRAHPDWCIHTNGRKRNLSRNQLVLDFSRKEVREYILESVRNILISANISYIKWDMNRCICDWGSEMLSSDNQQELAHRYILGLYEVLEKLSQEFPNVLFENCSSGGGRFDPGMLYYMPQTWCSDDSDAKERIYIQHGASMVYPVSSIGAHVSACPNHQIGRNTPMKLRGDVAMAGQLGYELDLTKLTDEETDIIAKQVEFYKKYRHVILQGDMYRLYSPYKNPYAAWQFISPDKSTVIMFTYIITGKPGVSAKRFRMQGLEPDSYYENIATKKKYSGTFLMNFGIARARDRDCLSDITVFKKI